MQLLFESHMTFYFSLAFLSLMLHSGKAQTCTVKPFEQCGGSKYSGPTCCPTGQTCVYKNVYWSGCLTASGPSPAPSTVTTRSPTQAAPAIVATPSPTRSPTSAAAIFNVTFSGRAPGLYSESMANADFNLTSNYLKGLNEKRGYVASDAGNPYLRVTYPAGCVGPDKCGVQMRFSLGATYSELWVSFRIRFETGFDWVKGGKLPGLCGKTCPTGCKYTEGFSARHMWRTDATAVDYTYEPLNNKTYSCGKDYDFGTFVAGRWHKIETRVKMNTGGATPNGVLQNFLDGKEVFLNSTVVWRTSDSAYGIDAFYFSTFYGGSDSTWAPSKNTYINFDDIAVSKTR